MKKCGIVIIILGALSFTNLYAAWYDGLGDSIFSSIGAGLAGMGVTMVTANPAAGIAGTAAGGYAGRQTWDFIYNTFNSPDGTTPFLFF